jgi:phage terminase large subunit GpA-like protein
MKKMKTNLPVYHPEHIKAVLRRNLLAVIIAGRMAVKPPPDIKPSVWVEENIYLPATSAITGRWRNENLPHGVEILDKTIDPEVRQITLIGSSQWGKTALIIAIILYRIALRACAMLLMQPTDSDARDFVRDKLEPMIELTPAVKNKVSKRNNWDQLSSTLKKMFPGGWLRVGTAKSASFKRQRSAGLVITDDIDAIVKGQTREGSPIFLLKSRATTYRDSLIIVASTPTIENESPVQDEYDNSSMAKFYVVCPDCGEEFYFEPEKLKWEKETDMFGKIIKQYPETAYYPCESCGTVINEKMRLEMLANGRWIHEHPEIKDHLGYWMPEISSSLSSFAKVARRIIDAGEDPEKQEALFNTVFGKCYKKLQGEEIDPDALWKRVENYIDLKNPRIPNEVLYLTCAIDRQHDRLEIMVEGWGLKEETWLCYYGRIEGDPLHRQVWDAAYKIIKGEWYRKDGVKLKISVTFVDSGDQPDSVYAFTRGKEYSESIWAIKGKGTAFLSITPRKYSVTGKKRNKFLILGTQQAKTRMFACLAQKNPGPLYKHFPLAYCDEDFFKQYSHEVGVKKYSNGIEYIYWDRPDSSKPNEVIDLSYMNLAAFKYKSPRLDALKVKWDAEAERLRQSAVGSGQSAIGRETQAEQTKIEFENVAEKQEVAVVKAEVKAKAKKKIKVKNNFINRW